MKKIIKNNRAALFLLANLLTVPTYCEAMEEVNLPKDADLRTLLKNTLQDDVQPGLANSSYERDIVVFLGYTGAGKSTLINYLANIPIKVDERGCIALAGNSISGAMKIGGSFKSETFLPQFIKSEDFAFYDLPGFSDTRGIEVRLANACFIKNIIEKAKTVKFVFVAGQDEITAVRGQAFKNLLATAKNLISNQSIEDLSSLVITKSVPRNTKQGLPSASKWTKENLIEFLIGWVGPEGKVGGQVDERDLTPWVAGRKLSKMSTPYMPEISDTDKARISNIIWVSPEINLEDKSRFTSAIYGNEEIKQEDKNRLAGIISNAKGISSEDKKCILSLISKSKQINQEDRRYILETISSTTSKKINNIDISAILQEGDLDRLKEVYSAEIKESISRLTNHCKELINRHSGSVQSLRNVLNGFCESLERIDSKESNPVDNLDVFLRMEEKYLDESLEEIQEGLRKRTQMYDLLRGLLTPHLPEWKYPENGYYEICSLVRDLTQLVSVSADRTGMTLQLKGFLIGTSDIPNAINSYPGKTLEVDVYSLNSLFIDLDIYFPGINLSLISPHWRIFGHRTIGIKGNDGPACYPIKARNGISRGCSGEDGIPGLSGNSGGNFYGKGEDFHNIYDLCLMGELPKDGKPLKGKMYLEKSGEQLKYKILDPDKNMVEDTLDIQIDAILTPKILNGFKHIILNNISQKSHTLHNPLWLTINVSGGKGGPGQDGGDGEKGIDNGQDGNLQDVVERKDSALKSRSEIRALAEYTNSRFKEIYETGTLGEKGGDGGKGGFGGLAGEPGSIIIESSTEIKLKAFILDQHMGSDGKPGKPANGGLNGVRYHGVYIKEIIAPNWRGYQTEKKMSNKECALNVAAAYTSGMSPFHMGLVSSYISTGWEEEPHKLDDLLQNNGVKPTKLNKENIQNSSKSIPINQREKEKYYRCFYNINSSNFFVEDDITNRIMHKLEISDRELKRQQELTEHWPNRSLQSIGSIAAYGALGQSRVMEALGLPADGASGQSRVYGWLGF